MREHLAAQKAERATPEPVGETSFKFYTPLACVEYRTTRTDGAALALGAGLTALAGGAALVLLRPRSQ